MEIDKIRPYYTSRRIKSNGARKICSNTLKQVKQEHDYVLGKNKAKNQK